MDTEKTINFTLNKKTETRPEGTVIRDLMNERNLKKAGVWVNDYQLLKAEFDTWEIKEGDVIRMLRIMAGG